MIPTYQNSSTSPFQDQLLPFYTQKSQSSFSSQDHRELHHIEYEQEASNLASHGGSQDHSDRGLKLCFLKKEEDGNENRGAHGGLVKGMPLKLRFRRKMNSSSDQMKCEDKKQPLSPMESGDSSNSFSNNNSPIRVCSDCNTTKTPLWRSGPRGPKSLCNACGIRQRKARRAMAAALAAANGTVLETETSRAKARAQVHKANKPKHGHVAQFKKRSKLANPTHTSNKICFEEFLINLSKNLAIHQVFPQDEKEAAILLMAISSGLVHG